jgi:hypothetical protein
MNKLFHEYAGQLHEFENKRASMQPLDAFSFPQFLLSQLKSGLSRASQPPHRTSDAAAQQLRS